MEQLASELERLNPNKNALASPLINAKWRLLYTTSASILGTTKPPFLRPQGPIYQTIDAVNLVAKNEETWPFFNQVRLQMGAGVWIPCNTYEYSPASCCAISAAWLRETNPSHASPAVCTL